MSESWIPTDPQPLAKKSRSLNVTYAIVVAVLVMLGVGVFTGAFDAQDDGPTTTMPLDDDARLFATAWVNEAQSEMEAALESTEQAADAAVYHDVSRLAMWLGRASDHYDNAAEVSRGLWGADTPLGESVIDTLEICSDTFATTEEIARGGDLNEIPAHIEGCTAAIAEADAEVEAALP